jgi:hypothetical protein
MAKQSYNSRRSRKWFLLFESFLGKGVTQSWNQSKATQFLRKGRGGMVLFNRMMWGHRRRLLNSPAEPNESVILELSRDWAPSNNS